MFLKILGLLDAIFGIVLIFESSLNISKFLLILFGVIFLLKAAWGGFKGFASRVDVFAGLVFILLIAISIPVIINIIVGIFLIQKGIFSFL